MYVERVSAFRNRYKAYSLYLNVMVSTCNCGVCKYHRNVTRDS